MELHFQCSTWRLLKNYLLRSFIWVLFVPDFGEIWWPHSTFLLMATNLRPFSFLLWVTNASRWHSGKESTCQCRKQGDLGSILGWGRSPEVENSNPFQYSCLVNPMDRGAWQVTVCGFTESDTTYQLSMHEHLNQRRGAGSTQWVSQVCSVPWVCNLNVYHSRLGKKNI